MAAGSNPGQSVLRRLWRAMLAYPVAGLGVVFVTGIISWGGFNWSLELTNTETFCVSCHEMNTFLYTEYKTTVHYANRTGVRASCPDCHVPREWIHKVIRKVGATNELFHWALGSIDTRQKFEQKRLTLAKHVWQGMKETESRECRNCHAMDSMDQEVQSKPAFVMHNLGIQWDLTCIDCHKGIAHLLPKDFDARAFMDDLHDRMVQEKIECRLCHEKMAVAPSGDDW